MKGSQSTDRNTKIFKVLKDELREALGTSLKRWTSWYLKEEAKSVKAKAAFRWIRMWKRKSDIDCFLVLRWFRDTLPWWIFQNNNVSNLSAEVSFTLISMVVLRVQLHKMNLSSGLKLFLAGCPGASQGPWSRRGFPTAQLLCIPAGLRIKFMSDVSGFDRP